MTYTAKAIADKLGIPPTTIRTWADRYKDFIPSKEKKHGRRQYNDEAVAVFKRIEQLHKDKLIGEQVREILDKEFKPVLEGEETPEGQGEQPERGLIPYQQFNDMLQFFRKKWQQDSELIGLQRQELKEVKEQTRVLKEALGIVGAEHLTKHRVTRPEKTGKKQVKSKKRQLAKVSKTAKKKRQRDNRGRFKKKSWLDGLLGRV
jgi:DNA-binding transcriptional MerR regulator